MRAVAGPSSLPDSTTTPARPVRFRRAADRTARRLGHAILLYLAVMVAIITLAPFHFESRPVHGLSPVWSWSDLVLNVVMFMPFGFVYQRTRPRSAPAPWWQVLAFGALLSGGIEVAQLFAPDRFPSLLDLGTNASGAVAGAWLYGRFASRVREDMAVQALALELPLMGLPYLLVPLCWLIGFGSEGGSRLLLLMPPALVAGAILGSVHAGYVRNGNDSPRWYVVAGLAWSLVALAPASRGHVGIVLGGTVLVLLTAWWRDRALSAVSEPPANRRFELPTLRLVSPCFAAYVALSALWPASGALAPWRGAYTLLPPDVILTQAGVFRALELVAAFTLVGYMGAEYHGRHDVTSRASLRRVLAWSMAVSALLEVARGFRADAGASLSQFLLTVIAAGFGHAVYERQRDHVRALLARRPRRPALRLLETDVPTVDPEPATPVRRAG